MSDSLNASAVLDTDKENEEVDAGLGSRPTEPDVIHSEVPEPAVTEENVPDPAEQGSDVEIIAALESLQTAEEIYVSLESAGAINKAMAVDISHRLPEVKLYPENYYTDKPSATHYQASLEAIQTYYTASAEGIIRDQHEDFRAIYAAIQVLFERSDIFAKKLKEKVSALKKDGFDQTEVEIRNKDILNTLAPEVGVSSASELIEATEDLLAFFEGATAEMNARSEFLRKVFQSKGVSKDEVLAFLSTPPSNSAYGRNNRWSETDKSSDTKRTYLSSKMAGGLQIRHIRPAKVKKDTVKPKINDYDVANVGKNPKTDGLFTVPDSVLLLNTLEKLADRIIELSAKNREAYKNVPRANKIPWEQTKKQLKGEFSLSFVLGNVIVNHTHLFFKEPVLVAGAVSRVTKAWLKLVESLSKNVSMESVDTQIDEAFNDLDDIENGLLTDSVALAPSPIVSEVPTEEVESEKEAQELPSDLDEHEPL